MWKFWQILLCFQGARLYALELADPLTAVDSLVANIGSREIPLRLADQITTIQDSKTLETTSAFIINKAVEGTAFESEDLVLEFPDLAVMQEFQLLVATASPSEQPSQLPTFAPSAITTEDPTASPSFSPSFVPSAVPSTAQPTFTPSQTPTLLPTTSNAPSYAPSQQSLPIVTFTSTLTLAGVTTPTLDGDVAAEASVSAATCTSMSLPTSDCSYVSSHFAPTAAPTSLRRKLETQTYNLVAVVQTSTTVPSGTSAATYGSTLTTTLSTAVTTHAFTANLVSASNTYGSGATANATVAAVTSTTPVVSSPSTNSNSNTVLSDGAIAGIVIGGVVFIAVVVFLLYYCCCRRYDEYVPSNAVIVRSNQNNKYSEQSTIVDRSKQDIVIAL